MARARTHARTEVGSVGFVGFNVPQNWIICPTFS